MKIDQPTVNCSFEIFLYKYSYSKQTISVIYFYVNPRKRNVPIQAETEEKVVQSPMNPDKEIEIFEENLKKRFQAKTITEFKCFDWSMIPNSEMKRLNSRTTGPKNIVVQSQL